jgi:hypothetical protein
MRIVFIDCCVGIVQRADPRQAVMKPARRMELRLDHHRSSRINEPPFRTNLRRREPFRERPQPTKRR